MARAELGEGSVRVSRVSPPPPAPQWWQWVCMGRGGGRWTPPSIEGPSTELSAGGGDGGNSMWGHTKATPSPPPPPRTVLQWSPKRRGWRWGASSVPPFSPQYGSHFWGREMISVCPPSTMSGGGGRRGHIERRALLGRGRPVGVVPPPPALPPPTSPSRYHETHTGQTRMWGVRPPQNKTLFASPLPLLSVPQWEVGGTRRPCWDLTSPPPVRRGGNGGERGWGERGRPSPAPPNRCGLRVV